MNKIFKVIAGIALFFIVPNTFGQECGTHATPEKIKLLSETRTQRANYQIGTTSRMPPTQVPIQIHILRTSSGSGGLTTSQITSVINDMNAYYVNANLEFVQCGSINYINNSNYYDFDQSQESALAGPNDVTNVINIYFFNSITSSSGSGLCGYTRFPPSTDRIFMANSCATNGSTMSHEMGHYFSLYHTHGKTNTGTTDEYVNGSNCTYAGDDLCDTPADPNLYGLIGSSCTYTGTTTDANGDTYAPDPTNIMSYSLQTCRNTLTTGQYNRVAYSYANDRSYLSCSGTGTTTYCNSGASSSADSDVENVTLNTINNSTNNCTGYSNFTSMSTTLIVGNSYNLSVTTGDCGSSAYNHRASAYIDWNGDGDFYDSGEEVLTGSFGAATTTSTTITVPSSASSPDTVRLRVVCTESSTISPCNTYSYGETEDYTIYIGSGACSFPAPSVSSNSRCGTGSISLSATPGSGGSTCRWYQNASGGTAIHTGATYTTPSLTSTTTYYVSTYDAGGCESSNRTAIVATINQDPTVSMSGLNSSYCENISTVNLIGTPNGGYFTGVGISGSTFSPSNAGVGTHTIAYNYTDGNGCTGTTSQNVTVSTAPTVSISNLASDYCSNDASVTLSLNPAYGTTGATLTGTGLSGDSFDPSAAGVGNHAIIYTYSSGGCTATDGKSVEVFDATNVTPSYTYTLDGLTLTMANNTTASYTGIEWDFGNGVTTNQENPTYSYTGSGIYDVCLTLETPCNEEIYCQEITVGTPKSIYGDYVKTFVIHPNPASNTLFINAELIEGKQVKMYITDIVGRNVSPVRNIGIVDNINTQFDVRNIESGIYFLQIEIEGEVTSHKFIVE